MTLPKRAADAQAQTRSKKNKLQLDRHESESNDLADSKSTPRTEDGASQEEDSDLLMEIATTLKEIASKSSKQDAWPKLFRQKLKNDEAKILMKLDAAKQKLTADKDQFEDQFLALLNTALAPIDVVSNVPQLMKPLPIIQITAEGQQLYEQSTNYLKESRSILQEYEKLASCELQQSKLAHMTGLFNRDIEQAKTSIVAGAKVTQYSIESLLADKYHETRGKQAPTKQEEEFGRPLLAQSQMSEDERAEPIGWGNIAYKAHKAIEKMHNIAFMDE